MLVDQMAAELFLKNFQPLLLEERPLDLDAPGRAAEIKVDGYRLLAEFGQGRCELMIRNRTSATAWFPEITRPLSLMTAFLGGPYVVDGEVCVLDDTGCSNVDRLHTRARRRSWYGGCDPVVFCVFDLLVDKGIDISQAPPLDRQARLWRLFDPAPPGVLVVRQCRETEGHRLCDGAILPLEPEGPVAKRVHSLYEPGICSSDGMQVDRPGAVPAERFTRT